MKRIVDFLQQNALPRARARGVYSLKMTVKSVEIRGWAPPGISKAFGKGSTKVATCDSGFGDFFPASTPRVILKERAGLADSVGAQASVLRCAAAEGTRAHSKT
jgi:hypothetical protein